MISAALFDLDDTLYPQSAWLAGAWAAVAARGGELGGSEPQLHHALLTVAARGSDQGHIIDRALAQCGATGVPVEELVKVFRDHAPTSLEPYNGVRAGLAALARRVPVGIVTDGDPNIQQAKLRALQLEIDLLVVYSDDLGREHRKPDALPFERALGSLGVEARDAVFVGDRPDKDVAGAAKVGMRSIRVHTGEYADRPDEPAPWSSVATVADAITVLRAELGGR